MLEEILQEKKSKMDAMSIPSWLIDSCHHCGAKTSIYDIIDIGISLTPKNFGNATVGYVCPGCSAMVELHYVGALSDITLNDFLGLSDRPSVPVPFEELINSKEHNLLRSLCKKK